MSEFTRNPKLFTTHDVALLVQADASTVSKWIDSGKLLAYRTPGGHRRVREQDLRAFFIAYGMPIPPELGGDGGVPVNGKSKVKVEAAPLPNNLGYSITILKGLTPENRERVLASVFHALRAAGYNPTTAST